MGIIEIGVLGPVEATRSGRPVELGGRQQRALLALLAVRAGSAVPVDALVDALWPEDPPPSAGKVVQTYVSRLRKALGDDVIERRVAGYALTVSADALDLGRFERLTAAGRLGEALAVWRGPALADLVALPGLRVEAERLEELRLSALEQRIEADLAAGAHVELIAELRRLVAAHPLRERFRAQLMLALYRADRQAEALAVYQEGRRRLIEDLGIEPGPALKELERAILRQERELDAPVRPPDARRRKRRWGLAAIALASAAAIAAVLAVMTRSDSGLMLEPRSLGRIDPDGNTIVGEAALGSRPAFMAADDRTVWVVGREGTLTQIDASRMRVELTRPLAVQPSGLALGANSLWVGDARRNWVLRVDLEHDAASDPIPLAEPSKRAAVLGSVAPSLAFGDGSLWISRGQTNVLRLDPQTHRVLADIRPPRGAAAAIAYGEDALWVAGTNAVSRVSPALNRATSSIRLEAMPVALATGHGAVWAALATAGKVARVDAETEAVETIAVGGAPTALAVGSDAVWVAVPSQGVVLRIDPDTNRVVARIATGATPAALASAGDSVWVAVT